MHTQSAHGQFPWPVDDPIGERCQGLHQLVYLLDAGKKARPQRHAVLLIVLMGELGFQPGHIHS